MSFKYTKHNVLDSESCLHTSCYWQNVTLL